MGIPVTLDGNVTVRVVLADANRDNMLVAIGQKLDTILQNMGLLFTEEQAMALDLNNLTTKVGAVETIDESVKTLLTSLVGEINDLKSQVSQDPTTQAAIDGLASRLMLLQLLLQQR